MHVQFLPTAVYGTAHDNALHKYINQSNLFATHAHIISETTSEWSPDTRGRYRVLSESVHVVRD